MGWQDDPIVAPQQQTAQAKQPWENDPVAYPAQTRVAKGVSEAWTAGYQSSLAGLIDRQKLPDIVLDPEHSKWYERAVSTVSTLVNEGPEMIGGMIAGGGAGSYAGPWGAVIGAGAGGFAVPTAIREAYSSALKSGQITASSDFLDRAKIAIKQLGNPDVLKATAKAGVVGAVTGGAGRGAGLLAEAAGFGTKATAASTLGAEGTALVVTPAVMEGRLPEPQEFLDAAILLGGLKGAHVVSSKLTDVYRRTGKTPAEVVADAQKDPTIAQDLAKGTAAEVQIRPEALAAEVKPESVVKAEPAKSEPTNRQMDLFGEEPTVPRAYETLAREQMLADVLGVDRAPKVAEVMANPEGKITVAKEPNHINYNYIESPTDVQQLHARISEVFKQEIEAQRGTESWNKTQEKAEALIRSRDPKDLVGKNYEDLAAEALAQQAMAQRAAFDLAKAASEVRAKGAEATPADHAKVVEAIETMSLLQAVDQKNGADIARALNSRKAAKQANQLGEAAGELLAKYGNDPAKLSEMIGELNTAEGLAKFARDASKATKWEKFIEAWKAGLVSGPVTQTANIIGNFTFAAARPLVDAAAVAVSKTRGALGGADTMSAVEPLARITGNFMGVVDGLKLAGAVLRTGVDMTKAESHRKAIEGPVGEVVRLPFRLLGAGDVFFRAMNERGEAYTLASRQAANEGYNPATREFRERVAELAMNPTDKMQEAIDAAGQRFTFNAPMGEVGRKIQSTVRAAHLEMVVPFIQTPTNVLKEMARLTPAAPLVEQWRADFKAGGAAKDKAIAEMALGTATSGAVMMLALSGSITGQGDPDPKVRAVQMASGWQPYSIKIGDTYYSYQRLQPLGTLIGMAADAAEVAKHTAVEERDKLGKILATAFGNAVTNQTFLQGISNIMGAITDPDAKGERFIQGMASSMIPGIVGQTAQMMDPYKREVYSVVDAIQYRLPFMREELMPKRDAYGVEIPEADRMGAVVPIVRSQESKDKVRTEAARLGVGVAKAPKSIELPSGGDSKLGKIELTDKQKDIFAESSGKLAHQILDNVVNTPGWDSLPDFAQKATFKQVFEKTRSYGNAMAVPPEQIMYEAQRIANELQIRMQPK